MAKLLLVEDDQNLVEVMVPRLKHEHYAVDVAPTCAHAVAFIASYIYDVIILDWQLPDGSGVELCSRWRTNRLATPVIMLTAKDALADRVTGLDTGADDYLTKPFQMTELLARLRSLTRRQVSDPVEILTLGDVVINPSSRTVMVNGQPASFAPREFELLQFLIQHANSALSGEALRVRVWGQDADIQPNAVNIIITRVRRKLARMRSRVSLLYKTGEGHIIADSGQSDRGSLL